VEDRDVGGKDELRSFVEFVVAELALLVEVAGVWFGWCVPSVTEDWSGDGSVDGCDDVNNRFRCL
jgi:hypothetical protein